MPTSSRPYLLRAMNEWIIDNDLTPHILVDASAPGVLVPGEYVKDDKIVLNISPGATRDLTIGNEELRFSARFNNKPMGIAVPTRAVLGIYARENGQGMLFPDEPPTEEASETGQPPTDKPSGKPHLTLVK